MEPKFEPVIPVSDLSAARKRLCYCPTSHVELAFPALQLQPSDPLSARIDDVMGTDYQNYIHCRNSDSKAISLLIGKSADRFVQHAVDWGRAAADGKQPSRPRVDRSSGLYVTGTRKSVAPAPKEASRGWESKITAAVFG